MQVQLSKLILASSSFRISGYEVEEWYTDVEEMPYTRLNLGNDSQVMVDVTQEVRLGEFNEGEATAIDSDGEPVVFKFLLTRPLLPSDLPA